MKWRGKIALWFWAIYGISNGAFIYAGITSQDGWGVVVAGMALIKNPSVRLQRKRSCLQN